MFGKDSTDWKAKYFDALAELERKEDEWKAGEALLAHAVNRLSLLAEGLDSRLDPHLESLRRGLRRGVDPLRLKADLERISSLLDELRILGQAGLDDEIVRLLDWLRLPPPRRAAVDALCVRLRQTRPPRDELLETLAAELNQVLMPIPVPAAMALPAPPSGAAAAAVDGQGRRGRTLVELLDWLRLPLAAEQAAVREKLRLSLSGPVPEERWPATVAGCAELINRSLAALGGERDELHGFLEHVTERLAVLELYVQTEREGAAGARAERERLELAVRAEMGGMRQGIAGAQALESLKAAVLGRLELIDRHLQAHKAASERRYGEIDARIQGLSEQLMAMGEEAHKLRTLIKEKDASLHRDVLTGLPNRRAWDERLAREYAHWQRHRRPLALLVWDIDHFKRINDNLGHIVGDQVLVAVSWLLAAGARESDLLARYGGEEFVMLLPNTDGAAALALAERIRADVAGGRLAVGEGSIGVTVSCGVTELGSGDTTTLAFERADRALYRAKRGGRNRCVLG